MTQGLTYLRCQGGQELDPWLTGGQSMDSSVTKLNTTQAEMVSFMCLLYKYKYD